jgi:GntR family transcriptional regulator
LDSHFVPVLRRPLFIEVRDRILQTLRARYGPGDRLPSEPDLAAAYGVSRPTIREVLGTFVTRTEPVITSNLDVDLGITEAVSAAHQRLGVQVLRVATERAPAEIAQQLELPLGSEVLWVERVIKANDVPAAHAIDAIPQEIIRDAGSPVYREGSVYRFLEADCGVELVGGSANVTAINADRRLARLLDIQVGNALIRMDQIERTASSKPVLYSSEQYVPSILNLTVRRTRVGQPAEPA